MNTITITVGCLNPEQAQVVIDTVRKIGATTGGVVNTAETRETKVAGPAETKPRRGKKAKPAVEADDELLEDEAEEADEEVEASSDDDMGELDEDLSEDEDADESDDEVTKEELQAAFKNFINKRKVKGKTDKALNRKDAIKILKSVKAKSVDEIKSKDYSKVMEQISI